MAFGEVTLIPGVNVERTPTLLRTGISVSQLIRFRDQLVQKYGGWQRFFNLVLNGTPRDLHVWEDLTQAIHLAIGTTTTLAVLTNGSLQDITPQSLVSNFTPNFSTIINTPNVTVTDPNVTNVTIYDTVFFNTPISVGGIVLSGVYPIAIALGGNSYEIIGPNNATATVNNNGVLPVFTTQTGSAVVKVTLPNNGVTTSGPGNIVVFSAFSSANGVTIFGDYTVSSIIDANNFNITVMNQATATGPFTMNTLNSGKAQLTYYFNIGPPTVGIGYGVGPYGVGGYQVGQGSSSQQTGTPITALDWTSGNWGEILLECPSNGPIFAWDPTAGFTNAGMVSTAPLINGGIFVSTTEQILVAWGSSLVEELGISQDPMLVQWSTVGDYTNWVASAQTQAGNFRIPIGSKIMAGLATPQQNLIFTDLDCWAMNYQGPPLVFGFNQIGAGAGAISSHAVQQLRGNVFWMGQSNFYSYNAGGVNVLPCTVWDFVFQNLNTAFARNVRAMPNTNFNEAGWLFPSQASVSGECDSYVKMNITEQGAPWDFGPAGNQLQRSAWTDQSILGPPLSASSGGVIYLQETTNDADGTPLMYSFTTGYFYLAEGEDFVFVDQILPDFKWGFYGQAQSATVQMTFNIVDYPGGTPRVYGPYSVTQATKYISVRFRGRQMSITVAGSDLGSFSRLGHVRYRWGPAGRR
jgi:hypothetical protein